MGLEVDRWEHSGRIFPTRMLRKSPGFSAVDVYSVIAYSTARRTHEIGIRMALGAQPQNILHLIVGQGGRMALVGIVLRLGASFAPTIGRPQAPHFRTG